MRRGTLIAASVLTSWAIPLASFAAAPSGTGASLWERAKALRASLESRIPENAAALLPDPAKKKSWDTERARHAQRLAELRRKCREEIRKANRDTVVEKTQQCFRSDLLEQLALHRKEKTYVASLPGIDAGTQAGFQAASQALMDAEVAVVNGVDTGVYATVELLESAKRKLRDQYRAPYWAALFRLAADAQVPWLAWQADRLEYLLSEKPETAATEAVGCLEEAVSLASQSAKSDDGTALESLRAALAKNRECVTTLRELIKAEG